MADLFWRASAIDIRSFELRTAARIRDELHPVVVALVADARAELCVLIDACSAREARDAVRPVQSGIRDSYLPFELAMDTAVERSLGCRQAVKEIATIANVELRLRQERLARCQTSPEAAFVLAECDSAARRVCKVSTAVDCAIAGAEGVPRLLDFTSELECSLAVRSAYAKFRARVLVDGDPEPSELHARFRAVGTALAVLVGWEVYTTMRVRDRLMLRQLQQRLLDWLRAGREADHEAGLHLWQDISACLEMLTLVNHRQELVQHDAAVVRQLLERAHWFEGAERIDEGVLELAGRLVGLDAELDALIAEGTTASVRDWSRVVQRLGLQLGVAGPCR